MVTIMIGRSPKEISWTSVSSTSSGSFGRARETRSRTRWMASLMTTSGSNSMMTALSPS